MGSKQSRTIHGMVHAGPDYAIIYKLALQASRDLNDITEIANTARDKHPIQKANKYQQKPRTRCDKDQITFV